ncbi:hypothetical protein [Halosolutus gelatinilyticus]|uniref:hypothetical protein n=1 Tax=Halosolutus gelatinilyticus TaxID=2931975 RepID=UPI001FF226B7|nr:hypothetical protein [Halosolutus gelatinilyticus]
MTTRAYNVATCDRPSYPDLREKFGEDPAYALGMDELYLAYARISTIDDLELLKEWQRVESENWGRPDVMMRLNARERELKGEPIEPTEPTTPDPAPAATDGGTAIVDEPAEPEVDDVHPGAKGLDVGEVLVLDRDDATEYIFPALEDADAPYLCRSITDDGDERTVGPIELTFDEVLKRVDGGLDPMSIEDVPIDAPRRAATNGGAE